MDINYQIAFTIELLHQYFADGKARDLYVYPSKDTKDLFKQVHMLWRARENRFIALMRENDVHEPFINTPPEKSYRKYFGESVFRFYLKAEDNGFLNYTNVATSSGRISYFNNLANNKVSRLPPALSSLYLSQKISDQEINRVYFPGEFAMKPGTAFVYEAIKKHEALALAELDDTTLWLPAKDLQFPSTEDQIAYAGNPYSFTLSASVTEAIVEVYGFNFDPDAPGFTRKVKDEVQSFTTPVSSIKIDLSGIPPGRYKLQVNGETGMIYYDPQLIKDPVFGVIEIFNFLTASGDYSFLDGNEVIQKKAYSIQFPARKVLWKYIRKDFKPNAITDTGSTNYVFNLIGNEFVSAIPIPLSEAVVDTLKLEFSTADHALLPLPNPNGNRLAMFHQDDYNYPCAEMYLNY